MSDENLYGWKLWQQKLIKIDKDSQIIYSVRNKFALTFALTIQSFDFYNG